MNKDERVLDKQEEKWLNISTHQDFARGQEVELNMLTGEKRKTSLDTAELESWVDSQRC